MSPLARDIAAFITRGESDFETLALRVFVHQYENDAPYRAFCDGRNATPGTVRDWTEIPAAPAAAFKRFALTAAPEAECVRVFHSSGTTGAETSRHFMDADALDLYRVSLRAGYERVVPPHPILALMPPPDDAPHSSLSFMLGELGARFFWNEGWQNRLAETLRATAEPVVVFGTAFAFVHFFDRVSDTFALPDGSRVIETGGFKGRSREIGRDELYALFTERLGVPETHCLAEYGMSEMASQFYGVGAGGAKIAPPWLRTRILDPVSGRDADEGLLAHVDLANLNSALAIQTEDWGRRDPNSDGFFLDGRAPGAILRGCSLIAEELLREPGR